MTRMSRASLIKTQRMFLDENRPGWEDEACSMQSEGISKGLARSIIFTRETLSLLSMSNYVIDDGDKQTIDWMENYGR